jgi:hypothetical protein
MKKLRQWSPDSLTAMRQNLQFPHFDPLISVYFFRPSLKIYAYAARTELSDCFSIAPETNEHKFNTRIVAQILHLISIPSGHSHTMDLEYHFTTEIGL